MDHTLYMYSATVNNVFMRKSECIETFYMTLLLWQITELQHVHALYGALGITIIRELPLDCMYDV